mgnify:CR=1 FL=1
MNTNQQEQIEKNIATPRPPFASQARINKYKNHTSPNQIPRLIITCVIIPRFKMALIIFKFDLTPYLMSWCSCNSSSIPSKVCAWISVLNLSFPWPIQKNFNASYATECNLRAFGGKKTGTQQLVWFIHSSMSSVVTSLPVLPCPSSKRRLVMRDLDSIILIHDQSVFTCMFELLPCSVPCPSNFVSLLWDTGLFLAHYGIWIRSSFSNAEDGDCSTSMRSHSQNTSTLW